MRKNVLLLMCLLVVGLVSASNPTVEDGYNAFTELIGDNYLGVGGNPDDWQFFDATPTTVVPNSPTGWTWRSGSLFIGDNMPNSPDHYGFVDGGEDIVHPATGLIPNETYDVYVFQGGTPGSSTVSGIAAGLSYPPTEYADVPPYQAPVPPYMIGLEFYDPQDDDTLTNNPFYWQSGLRMWTISIGTGVTDSAGTLPIYLGNIPGSRAWYDGFMVRDLKTRIRATNIYPPDGAIEIPEDVVFQWNTAADPAADPNDPNLPNPDVDGHYLNYVAYPVNDYPSEPNFLEWTTVFVSDTTDPIESSSINFGKDKKVFWTVDERVNGSLQSEPNTIRGMIWSFETVLTDQPPESVDAGPDMVAWPDEAVQLFVDIVDDGKSPLTITWEADDPNAVFSDASAQDPTITVDYPAGPVTVTVTVQDELNPPVSDTLIVNVYADACEATRVGAELAAENPEDVVDDCVIDLEDFAAIAARWLEDYTLTTPVPVPVE